MPRPKPRRPVMQLVACPQSAEFRSVRIVDLYFSDYFGVSTAMIDAYGAFDVSLASDLPLFIDPFHLFNSERPEFQTLHESIVRYLRYLRDRSNEPLTTGVMETLYCFPEVVRTGSGSRSSETAAMGSAEDFARGLHAAFQGILKDFGDETVTSGSHLEKVTLVASGVGQDNISDFTTNLINESDGFARDQRDGLIQDHRVAG